MSTLYVSIVHNGVEVSAYPFDHDIRDNNTITISKLDNTITLPEAIRNILSNIFKDADITVIEE